MEKKGQGSFTQQVLQEIMERQVALQPVVDEMLDRFVELITSHPLSNGDSLLLVAYLAASHVHSMKSLMDSPESKDAVEDFYHEAFQTYLGTLDMIETDKEIEREYKERLN